MASFIRNLSLLALVGAQGALANSVYATDITIALLESSSSKGKCDISSAPTMHINGATNITDFIHDVDLWINSTTGSANMSAPSGLNFTLSNAQNYKLNTSYTGIYYQQLSGNNTEDQAKDTLGLLKLATFPCPQGATSCSEASTSKGQGLSADSWLEWSCYDEGACYQTGYAIKSFSFGDTADNIVNATSSEVNNKCELATVHYQNATKNNDTDTHEGAGSSLSAAGSMAGVWSTAAVVLGMLAWM